MSNGRRKMIRDVNVTFRNLPGATNDPRLTLACLLRPVEVDLDNKLADVTASLGSDSAGGAFGV